MQEAGEEILAGPRADTPTTHEPAGGLKKSVKTWMKKSAIRGGGPMLNGKSHEQFPFLGGNPSLRFIAFLSVCSEFDTLVLVCKKVKKKERL